MEEIQEIPIEEEEDLSYIREAVLKLPDKYKSVIYLFYYEGYTAVEIAGILHKKENTIQKLVTLFLTVIILLGVLLALIKYSIRRI